MNQSDITSQIIRIIGWMLLPLLAKWGFDTANAMVIVTALGTLCGVAVWWAWQNLFANRFG